jgi:hypothetical protein
MDNRRQMIHYNKNDVTKAVRLNRQHVCIILRIFVTWPVIIIHAFKKSYPCQRLICTIVFFQINEICTWNKIGVQIDEMISWHFTKYYNINIRIYLTEKHPFRKSYPINPVFWLDDFRVPVRVQNLYSRMFFDHMDCSLFNCCLTCYCYNLISCSAKTSGNIRDTCNLHEAL